jgi:hypothetical protein
MRFIFSLVANITYTLFACSIQFIILHFYHIICFPALYMLSSSLVVFTLYESAIMYGICITILIIFDIDTFRSQNDISGDNMKATESAVVADDMDEIIPSNMDTTQTVSPATVYNETYVNALISVLLCHITVFVAVLAIFIVCLCECMYVRDSQLCNMSLGSHSMNNAIAIALILLTISILLPLLNLYKLNAGTSTVFYNHMPTMVVFFICLMQIAILSKFIFYSVSCPLMVSFSGSMILVYCTIILHFGIRLCDYMICSLYTTPQSPRSTHTYTSVYSNFACLTLNTMLLLGNLAYAWPISTFFNLVQSLVIVVFIGMMGCRSAPPILPITYRTKNE